MEHYFELPPLQAAGDPAGAGADRMAGLTLPRNWELTPSEGRVVRLLASAHTTGEIARSLGLSIHTVRTHVKRAMSKASVHTQAALVARVYVSRR
jgi:DNA-binding CsgD family transcriptional regulator